MRNPDCPLCQTTGGALLWEHDLLRVIDAQDPAYPGFTRVIWHDHVAEMTDLDVAQQQSLMQVVLCVEQVMRTHLRPDKVNLAAFGNQVPHLHWHVIPRWADDAHFPQPVWASLPQASPEAFATHQARRERVALDVPAFHRALSVALQQRAQG